MTRKKPTVAAIPKLPKVLVVCARQYNGHELWTALGIIQEAGIEFEVVSQALYIQDEVTGQPNVIDRIVHQVSVEEMRSKFGAIMIVSGNMADTERYWKDRHVLDLIAAVEEYKGPIAAICCSVPTIREAAMGKRVSYFPLVRSKELLSRAGAICQTVAWTVDGNLVTAEHQMATQMWAESFVKVIKGEVVETTLVDSGYMPKGLPRKPIPEIEALKRANREAK